MIEREGERERLLHSSMFRLESSRKKGILRGMFLVINLTSKSSNKFQPENDFSNIRRKLEDALFATERSMTMKIWAASAETK